MVRRVRAIKVLKAESSSIIESLPNKINDKLGIVASKLLLFIELQDYKKESNTESKKRN